MTTARLDQGTTAILQQSFEKAFATTFAGGVQTPGAIAYVSIGDQEWISALGVSDIDSQAPLDSSGHGRIGSISKPFVATAVLLAVDEGKLSLDDTLGKYIPGIANGDVITLRQLLNMSAGVWSYTSDADLISRFQSDPMAAWTIDQTIDLIRSHPADFAPEAKFAYSDSDYVLLGRVLEIITGQPISEVIRTRVVEPLGLTGTRMPTQDEPGVPDPSVGSYMPVDQSLVPVPSINPNFAWTAGAMTSTASDLAVFARALADGTLISPELHQEQVAIPAFDGVTATIGYGFGVIRINDLVGHSGAINGGGASMFRYPEQDATFVVLVNGSSNFENTADIILNSLVGDLYPAQTRR